MRVREATGHDSGTVAELRLRFLAEHRRIAPNLFTDAFRIETHEFLRRHLRTATSRSWLAEEDHVAVGVVTMLVLDLAL